MTWWQRSGRWIRAPRRPAPLPPREPRPARALFALLQAVVRVGKCKLFGHAFKQIIVPVPIEALERFGHMPGYVEMRLMFENVIRVGRMVQPPILERRCRRCYVTPPLSRARARASS